MKHLDFLCPREYGDSYEACDANPNSYEAMGGYEISNSQDLFNCLRGFLNTETEYFKLFRVVQIYLDMELFGELNTKGEFRRYPPTTYKHSKNGTIYYKAPIGDKTFLYDVKTQRYLGRD